MNVLPEAHANLWRQIIDLLIESGWKKRDATADADVVRQAVGDARKKELVVGKVSFAFLEHLACRGEEKARRVRIGKPVLAVPHLTRIRFDDLPNIRDCNRNP